jgi:hypothetical protein
LDKLYANKNPQIGMALSALHGIPSGGEDFQRQSPRLHFEPLMRYLKVILVGACGLGILWLLMVWLLAPDEVTNQYLPTALQKTDQEKSVVEVPVKKKTDAPVLTNRHSVELTGATNLAREFPGEKPSPEPATGLAGNFGSSNKPQEPNEERNSSFEKEKVGPFDQLKNSIGIWTTKAGTVLIDDKHSKTGKQCLQLTGGENSIVTLEIAGKLQLPSELTFFAERWTSQSPFTFRILAEREDGRKEIYDGDNEIRVGRTFQNHVKVQLSAGVKRLQFSCTSPSNTGILIDDLRISPSRPAEIENEPNAESSKPQEPPPDLEDRAALARVLANAIDEREMKARTVKGKKQLMQNDKPFTGWAKRMRGNSGKVEELGLYRGGLKNGPWAKWFAGKRFSELGLFRQGQRHGLYVTWYGSGKKKDSINYENDLEHGPVITWYGSGKKWKEGNHKHGERDGVWVTYDGRGKERNRQRYENGNPLD